MIYRDKILAALEGCESAFALYENDLREQIATYNVALDATAKMNREEFAAKLPASAPCGAIPTEDFFNAQSFVIPFNQQWTNREEAREYAYQVLQNRTTFAADGSQILPTKDFSIPVAAVQIGWFENPHTTDGIYNKNATFEIIPPEKIMVRTGGD